ncbi:MAG: hypothetical protein NT069_19215, partial [Planctomycetota bacterium]|nr:hypothetical protein [Planctomycetota bacterium]
MAANTSSYFALNDLTHGNSNWYRINPEFLNSGIVQYRNSPAAKPATSNRLFTELSRNNAPLWGVNPNGEYQVLNRLSVATLAKLAAEGMEIVPSAPS